MEKETRDRKRPLCVYVSPPERGEIAARAASSGLSVSDYLRTAGLNHPIRSVADADAVADLMKVSGDLGRLGGLLKSWLNDTPGKGAPVGDVLGLLHEILLRQKEMRSIASRILRP